MMGCLQGNAHAHTHFTLQIWKCLCRSTDCEDWLQRAFLRKRTNSTAAQHYLIKKINKQKRKCKFHNEQWRRPIIATAVFHENDECSADKTIKDGYVELQWNNKVLGF